MGSTMKIIEVKSAVFLEQSEQVLSGHSDPDRLSEASQRASQSSQRFAQVLAMVDAEAATEAHKQS